MTEVNIHFDQEAWELMMQQQTSRVPMMYKRPLQVVIDRFREISSTAHDTNPVNRILKLQEELGELSAVILLQSGYKLRTPENECDVAEEVIKEACDVFMVTLDLLCVLGISDDRLAEIVEAKLEKWNKAINQRNKEVAI